MTPESDALSPQILETAEGNVRHNRVCLVVIQLIDL